MNRTCKYLTRPSQLIKDKTGEGNDYIDTYYYCTLLKKRMFKRSCGNCKNFTNLTYSI